ncbi:MAG: heme-binding domain-containing protein [Acidobacteriota bacterium]
MLKKIIKITMIVIVAAFIIGQFVRPDFSNPAVVESETLGASTQVPQDIQAVLARSCNDCHSNETRYPWYSKVTPFNWFLADHIQDGRREMNFSVWNTYRPQKKIKKLEDLCEQVEQAEMPLPSYLWIHREAVMAEGDAALLCNWAKSESARIESTNQGG